MRSTDPKRAMCLVDAILCFDCKIFHLNNSENRYGFLLFDGSITKTQIPIILTLVIGVYTFHTCYTYVVLFIIFAENPARTTNVPTTAQGSRVATAST